MQNRQEEYNEDSISYDREKHNEIFMQVCFVNRIRPLLHQKCFPLELQNMIGKSEMGLDPFPSLPNT